VYDFAGQEKNFNQRGPILKSAKGEKKKTFKEKDDNISIFPSQRVGRTTRQRKKGKKKEKSRGE